MPIETINKRVGKVLEKYLLQTAEQLRVDYLASGLKASGNYGENIKVFLDDKSLNRVKGRIEVPHYAEYMTFGRDPTTKSEGNILFGIIKDWVLIKPGLPPDGWTVEGFAFVVTRRIHEEGIIVPNRFNPGDVTTKAIEGFTANLPKIIEEIGTISVRAIQSDLVVDIIDQIQEAFKE